MKTHLGIVILLAVLSGTDAMGAEFTVFVTDDSGPGSLRQAILDNNASPSASPNRIVFAIAGDGPHTITPSSVLPDITQPVIVDGYTQMNSRPNSLTSGNNAVIQIRLNGSGAFGADGLRLRAAGSQVRGLSITRFANSGVDIRGATGCVVAGNFIGLAPDGTAQANNGSGVLIFDTPGNRIGGAEPGDRNVVSGNFTAGLHLLGAGASNNVVVGNYIGTTPDGLTARPNFVNGIYIQDAPDNRVGGAQPGARNVISGNTPDGIRISGGTAVRNLILGNYIGTDSVGAARLGSQNGVNLDSGPANRVGGAGPGEGNLISGNGGFGVGIGFTSSGNVILGNRIGVDPVGGALTNGGRGVVISGSGNRIGGVLPGEANEVAYNHPGIEVTAGTGNAIRGNSIYDNRPSFALFGGLGIDLGGNGLTANDADDADGGANQLQNYPVLTNAIATENSARLQGVLHSQPRREFALDFFSSPDCDPSGHGEGRTYLGAASVTTDEAGFVAFDVLLPVAIEGRQITATATDPDGNTSEFSPCLTATLMRPPERFFVTNPNDHGPGSLRQALQDAQSEPASANNVVAFNIGSSEGGDSPTIVIRLATPLAPIYEAITIDGFTQPGANANQVSDGNNASWRIRLDGSQLGPGVDGLVLGAPGCVVRGLGIEGFRGFGIRVQGEGRLSLVDGCHIAGNQLGGVLLDSAAEVILGGTSPSNRNVIHANGIGIQIDGAAATGNVIQGNFIGPDPAGAAGSANTGGGILIMNSASGTLVGGSAPGAGNRIAFNNHTGVGIWSGTGNSVIGNSIVANLGPGIDVFPGANGDPIAPIIAGATVLANGLQCHGTFSGIPNAAHTLHAYSSREPGANGEFYLGLGQASTDSSGVATFNFTAPGTFLGRYLTLTLTGPDGSTSGFSDSWTPASVRPPGTFTVTTTSDSGLGSLRQAITDANNYLVSGNNVVDFNIPAPGIQVIQPKQLLPASLDSITINGFSQPGSRPNTLVVGNNAAHLIQLDGALLEEGVALSLAAPGSIVQGLSVTRFGTAFHLGGAGGHRLQGNRIGVDPQGLAAGNTWDAVVATSPNNLIGGTEPADRNVISANGRSGVVLAGLEATGNRVQGNLIGTDLDTFMDLGNGRDGVHTTAEASDNWIGGTDPLAGNLFGFNSLRAVYLESGQRNAILNNSFVARPPPATTEGFLALGQGANDNIPPPILRSALSDPLSLRVSLAYTGGRPNTRYEGEIYTGEKPAGAPYDLLVFRPIHRFYLDTDTAGQASREELVTTITTSFTRTWALLRDPTGNSSPPSGLVTALPAGSADLQTRLFAPPSVTAGSNFTVTIVVTNNGPASATGVTARQILGLGMDIVSVSAPGAHTVNGSIVDFTLGDLAAGQAATVTLTLRGTQSSLYQFSARANHQGVDANWSNDLDATTLRVVPPPASPQADLAVQASAPDVSLVPGEIGVLTFRMDNRGPAAAANVRAAIRLPFGSYVESVEAPPDMTCTVSGSYLECTTDTMEAGREVKITVRARFEGHGTGSAFEDAEFKAWSDTPDPDAINNQDDDPIRIFTPLSLHYDGTTHQIAWPAPSPGVALQSTPHVDGNPPWTYVPTNAIVITNDMHTFILIPQAPGSPSSQFYRLVTTTPAEPQGEFNQLSLELDGVKLPFSDWGQFSLRLPWSADVHYLNLTYNDHWVVQNLPIVSGLNSNVADFHHVNFPLDVYGRPVFTANTGFTITTNTSLMPPISTNSTFMGSTSHVLASGEMNTRLVYTPPQILAGGPSLLTARAPRTFPNREQRKNECAPAAILNSLQYLQAGFGLQFPEKAIRLQTIKDAIGWDASGAPVGDDPQKPEWVEGKKQHMTDNNLPVETELTTSANVAAAAVNLGYDVEIRVKGHVACVVDITDVGGGAYSLTLSHDVSQGEDGGNILESTILNTHTRTLRGSTWSSEFQQFIIERPKP